MEITVKTTNFDSKTYNRIQEILDIVEEDGLPEPRDLDVALDALLCTIDAVDTCGEAAFEELAEYVENLGCGDMNTQAKNNEYRLAITDTLEEIAGLASPIELALN